MEARTPTRTANCARINLNAAAPTAEARRSEAALTSGVVPWNRLPASFRRVNSAKRCSTPGSEEPPTPAPTPTPTPSLALQPSRRGRGAAGETRRSIVVTLPLDGGAVRPKTANFPARNFLAGYRQIPARAASAHRRDSDSILMMAPGVHNGRHASAKPDLDRMDAAELNQIFEELAAGADDGEETPPGPQEEQRRPAPAPRVRAWIHPAATALADDADSCPPSDSQSAASQLDFPPEGYIGGRATPTFVRLGSGRPVDGAGRVVQSHDNFIYVPRPKTRLCRVYVGTTVARPPGRDRALEFMTVNRRASLHHRREACYRHPASRGGRPVEYSTNFSTNCGPVRRPAASPEPQCFMCAQHQPR